MLQENDMRMSPNYDYIQFSAMSPTKISLPKQAHERKETDYSEKHHSQRNKNKEQLETIEDKQLL